MARFTVLAAALLIAASAALGGCGGADLALSGQAADGTSTDAPTRGPFNDQGPQAITGREVIAAPTIAQIMAPSSTLPEMSLGRADAPVTIVKYASMTCPYCSKFQREVFPELKRQYIDTGKVRLILREFPIGFQSGAATIALRCAPTDKQFALYDKLMSQQAAWVSQEVRTEPIFKVAAQTGMTRAQFDECRQDQALIGELNKVKERARSLGIIGTPNFFINGRLIKTELSLPGVKAIIDPLLAGAGKV